MTSTLDSSTNSYKINHSSSDSNYYTEAMPTDEYNSINTNKGYYIGRFEAGDSTLPTAGTSSLRGEGASQTNAIAIKKGYAPYNYITRTNAKNLAEAMDSAQSYSATTKLCSSYAWDTAINFIQNKVSGYGSSSPQGNYKDVTSFTYKDITGATQTKANGDSTLIPTGQTTAVCNIYDLGGNVWEWTTESCSDSSLPYAIRGGDSVVDYGVYPAGLRGCISDGTYGGLGFRVTLFL